MHLLQKTECWQAFQSRPESTRHFSSSKYSLAHLLRRIRSSISGESLLRAGECRGFELAAGPSIAALTYMDLAYTKTQHHLFPCPAEGGSKREES